MKFRLIDSNVDHIINKRYYLCKVNLNELADYVKKKFTDLTLDDFNEEEESDIQQFIFEASTENNFISLYSEKVNFLDEHTLKCSGKFYLLDGFRRLLF